ncbi:MAG: hypothetical protein ACK4WH_09700 [Phycisphaerales bacterium]
MNARSAHPDGWSPLKRTVCGVVLLMAGCAGNAGSENSRQTVQTLSPQDFAASETQTRPAPGLPVAVMAGAQTPATPPSTTLGGRDRFRPAPEPYKPCGDETLDAAALVGAPVIPPPPRAATPEDVPTGGKVVVYESLVGQINGKPVFASQVLEPLDGRLRASAARTKDARRWSTEARSLIAARVRLMVDEELVLAEARSSLSPEQRQGLFSFLSRIQENMVAQQGGSAVAADEAARATTGRSLTQTTRDKLDEALIREEVRQRIGARLLVTWRQIQLEYEREADKYNPKPIAMLQLVAIPAANAEAVEQVKSRLAAGEQFESVSDIQANALRGEAGLLAQPINGSLAETTLVGIEPLNQAARSLQVGGVAGPVTHDGAVWWVKLARIEQPPAVSLYDAQLEIESALLDKRKEIELSRYSNRLRSRGNFSRVEDMVEKLMAIATERYWNAAQ